MKVKLVIIAIACCLFWGVGCAKKQVQSDPEQTTGSEVVDTSAQEAEAERQAELERQRLEEEQQRLREQELTEQRRLEAEQARLRKEQERELQIMQKEEAFSALQSEKVFFDFDSFELKPEARAILQRKAQILKQWSEIKLMIEGNCDDRGTAEYNLALGERRARAAYEFLVLLGVDSNRLQIISYGEEYPIDPANNETAWAMNRRDEFRILGSNP